MTAYCVGVFGFVAISATPPAGPCESTPVCCGRSSARPSHSSPGCRGCRTGSSLPRRVACGEDESPLDLPPVLGVSLDLLAIVFLLSSCGYSAQAALPRGFALLARLETEGQPQLDEGLGNPHGVCPTVIRKATATKEPPRTSAGGRGADVTDILRPSYYDKLRPAIRKLNPEDPPGF